MRPIATRQEELYSLHALLVCASPSAQGYLLMLACSCYTCCPACFPCPTGSAVTMNKDLGISTATYGLGSGLYFIGTPGSSPS